MALWLSLVAAGLFACMALAWLCQRTAGNAGWVDVFWTFGVGIAGAAAALYPSEESFAPRRWLVAFLALAWTLRLGWHVAARVARTPEDRRYQELREQWGPRFQPTMFAFLQLQALVSLPLVGAIYLAAHRPDPAFGLADAVGVLVLIIAVLGEGLADAQLDRFKADPNHGPINDRGLWAWSRHPNYFFEWLGWWAYPIIALQLSGYPQGWLAFIAPAVMYAVLVWMTGVPALEKHMAASRGEAWRDYAHRTGRFIPRPPKVA
jgi:steroid 5-alpha reductase family enzyme